MWTFFPNKSNVLICFIKLYSQFTDSVQMRQHYKYYSIAVYCSAISRVFQYFWCFRLLCHQCDM